MSVRTEYWNSPYKGDVCSPYTSERHNGMQLKLNVEDYEKNSGDIDKLSQEDLDKLTGVVLAEQINRMARKNLIRKYNGKVERAMQFSGAVNIRYHGNHERVTNLVVDATDYTVGPFREHKDKINTVITLPLCAPIGAMYKTNSITGPMDTWVCVGKRETCETAIWHRL